MKTNSNKAADAVRILLSVVLAAIFLSTLLFARAEANDAVSGAGIGVSDGDRDGDGMIEGVGAGPESGIGESISRGLEEIKDGAESLAEGLIGGEGTEGIGRGPVETDPGVVKDTEPYAVPNEENSNSEKEPADTFWALASVVAAVAAIAAIAVAVPKKTPKKEDE